MPKTRGSYMHTDKGKAIGKSQLYALLVDENRNPVLDTDGNEQLVDLEIVNGRLKVDAAIVGSLAKNETDKAVTADTNIWAGNYTPSAYQNSKLVVGANISGVLSLVIDGKALTLNSGAALVAGAAYTFDVPLLSGSTYNLKYSQTATMQIKWQVI